MKDISNKDEVLCWAKSQSIVRVNPESLESIKNDKECEINLIESARVAAILAAKKTWEIIPDSHQKLVDHVKVDVHVRKELVEIVVEVRGFSKTSFATESLTAATTAAITIFEKLREKEESISIESVRLLKESNAILDSIEMGDKKIRAAILVINDSKTLQNKTDQIKKVIVDKLDGNNLHVVKFEITDNEQTNIESKLKRLCDVDKVGLVVTFGDTGIKSKNIIISITEKIIDKKIEGIPEMIRERQNRRSSSGILHRGTAGIRKKSIIINLSKNIKEISESLDLLTPYIMHIHKTVERN